MRRPDIQPLAMMILHTMIFRAALDCVDHLTVVNDGFMRILLRWTRGNNHAFLAEGSRVGL